MTHNFIPDLAGLIPELPPDSIVSRTFHEDDRQKAILFGFAAGQQLSEHTASQPAILQFLRGEAEVTLGEETMHAGPGSWAFMPAQLPHSIYAETELFMLLLLYKE